MLHQCNVVYRVAADIDPSMAIGNAFSRVAFECCGARMISRRGPARAVPAFDPFAATPCSVYYTSEVPITTYIRLRRYTTFEIYAVPSNGSLVSVECDRRNRPLLFDQLHSASFRQTQSFRADVDPPAPIPHLLHTAYLYLYSEVLSWVCCSTAAPSTPPPSSVARNDVVPSLLSATRSSLSHLSLVCVAVCVCLAFTACAPVFRLPPTCHRSLHTRDTSRPPAAASAATAQARISSSH